MEVRARDTVFKSIYCSDIMSLKGENIIKHKGKEEFYRVNEEIWLKPFKNLNCARFFPFS